MLLLLLNDLIFQISYTAQLNFYNFMQFAQIEINFNLSVLNFCLAVYILQQLLQSKLFPYNKRLHLLFIHIVCNLYMIINSRLPGEIILMNKYVVGGTVLHKHIF